MLDDDQLFMRDYPTTTDSKWVIGLQSDPNTYWNNNSGWGDLMTAEKYSSWEKVDIRLPLQGMWVSYEEALEDYNPDAYP